MYVFAFYIPSGAGRDRITFFSSKQMVSCVITMIFYEFLTEQVFLWYEFVDVFISSLAFQTLSKWYVLSD